MVKLASARAQWAKFLPRNLIIWILSIVLNIIYGLYGLNRERFLLVGHNPLPGRNLKVVEGGVGVWTGQNDLLEMATASKT